MIYKDREWHVTERVYHEDKSYSPQRASKFLIRSRLDKPPYYGTMLSVQETLNRDYPYRLMVYSGFDKSRGTKNMIGNAHKYNLKVFTIVYK